MNAPAGTAIRSETGALGMNPREQFVLLGALSMFAPLSTDMYLPGLPSVAHDLSAAASAVTLTLTASLVGLGLGQLVAGPLSDAFGRRRPLLVGLALYTASSLLCAFAPDVWTLSFVRLLQGAAGAAGIVIARAIVSDLYSGRAAARYFARLTIISGLAPTLAPIIGGQLLHVTSWRGIFVVLAAIGALLTLWSWRRLGETLPPQSRQSRGLATMRTVMGVLVRDRAFMGLTIGYAFLFGASFAYISGSPFVLEDVFGLSPQLFAVVFAMNAAGLIVCSQISGRLVTGVGPSRLLAVGVGICVTSGTGLLVAVLVHGGLLAVEACFFTLWAGYGFATPNVTALALARHRHVAGSASALMGALQFCIGASLAPLVGVGGDHTDIPTGSLIFALVLLSAALFARSLRASPAHTESAVAEAG